MIASRKILYKILKNQRERVYCFILFFHIFSYWRFVPIDDMVKTLYDSKKYEGV